MRRIVQSVGKISKRPKKGSGGSFLVAGSRFRDRAPVLLMAFETNFANCGESS
jgi:hypothetical protein